MRRQAAVAAFPTLTRSFAQLVVPTLFLLGCGKGVATTMSPDPGCAGGTTQAGSTACGVNGRGTLTQDCIAGAWQDSSACADPDVCGDAETRDGTTPCGRNGRGTLRQDCSAGAWQETTACVDPDVCVDAQTEVGPAVCGLTGSATLLQICVTGAWQDTGVCYDPGGGPVSPIEVRQSRGGGFTAGGLVGDYFANEAMSGVASFSRRDVRIDFDWGQWVTPGGSTSPGFKDVPHDHFSVVWQGALIAAFSETYVLYVDAIDGARLSLRPSGGGAYTTLMDFFTGEPGNHSVAYEFTAGQTYDVRLEYRHGSGPARVTMLWSSPSVPLEVVDVTANLGIDMQFKESAFTDIIKGARNSWDAYNYALGLDSNGWPYGDCNYVLQETLNQGLAVDPLMRGTIGFQFKGTAAVNASGNVKTGSVTSSYDALSNTTTGSFIAEDRGINATYLRLTNTHRVGTTGVGGFTDLKVMRPNAVDSTTPFPFTDGPIFVPQYKDAYMRYTAVRHQMVADHEQDWLDRTLPGWFNQSNGRLSRPKVYSAANPPGTLLSPRQDLTAYTAGSEMTLVAADGLPHTYYANNTGTTAASQSPSFKGAPGESVLDGDITMLERGFPNGPSWEYKILFCNETGRDLFISIPTLASDDYIVNLARLLRYGSDGVTPYTTETQDPVYPPLNPNLRVFFEWENELWNWGGAFYRDAHNVFNLVYGDADSNNADFQILNYDGMPTTKDALGNYLSVNTWVHRKRIFRPKQFSDIFATVWGQSALHRRVRPLYEWQYDNQNATASVPLRFLDTYFNNADGLAHVATPQPPSAFLWGGGGAIYYGATDPDGLTDAIDGFFATPAVTAGYAPAPLGGPWTFSGSAGIARPVSGAADPTTGNVVGDDIPQGPTTKGARQNSTIYAPGDTVYLTANDGNRHVYRCTTGGTSASAQGVLYAGGVGEMVTDGTAAFTEFTTQVAYLQDTGTMAYTFTVPPFTSPYFAVSFKALNHKIVTADAQVVRLYLDGTEVTARTYSQPNGVKPPAYDGSAFGGPNWYAQNVSWTTSKYYSTKIFAAAAPSESHTIELRGQIAGNTVFISDVRLASVDAIFASGVPGGGQAAGQPAGQRYTAVLAAEASWAHAYGLQPAAYEGGWSVGGDDGGTSLQNQAKMGGGDLTRDAHKAALDIWHRVGGAFASLGTYTEWPHFRDFFAVQGLLNIDNWPLVQGVSLVLNSLRASAVAPAEGAAPGTLLDWSNAVIKVGNQYQKQLRERGAWTAWNVIVPAAGSYVVTLNAWTADAGPAAVAVIADGGTIMSTTTPGSLSVSVTLSKGLHTLRVQSSSAGYVSYASLVVSP